MSGNLDNDRSVTTNKMYPIDLAPQKITIVKSVSNSEVKMAPLISGQPKASGSSQMGTHGGATSGLMRSNLAQIISPNSSSQMILSSSTILQGTQIVSQGAQLHNQGSQIIPQSQILTSGGQLLSPGTQIISQGTQLSAPTCNTNSNVTSVSSAIGAPVLNVGNQLSSGASNLVVNSSVRTLQPTVRVLPTLPHHNNRSATVLTSVNVSSASNMLVNKGVNVGVTSHVPRGLAAGASLALRPVTPSAIQPVSSQNISGNNAWGGAVGSSTSRAARGALVYGSRARASLPAPVSAHQPHSTVVTLSTSSVLNSTGVISGTVRGVTPRAPTPAPTASRPLPLLQRNYQPAKVVGVSSVGVRGVVGNSAPTQLYYEVPRAATPSHVPTHTSTHASSHAPPHAPTHTPTHALTHAPSHAPRPLTPYPHVTQSHHQPTQAVNIVNASVTSLIESRSTVSIQTAPTLAARPTILRKRDIDGSPTKSTSITYQVERSGPGTGWEDVAAAAGSGGSTTVSASSSPPPDHDHDHEHDHDHDHIRKKPRKQVLSNDVRHCDFPAEEPPPSPPPVTINPPPKRPQLSSSYVCGWRGTALHFARPADVRRREVKPRDIVAIASQKHVLASAEGWKVHHLTAQMDDLMSLESDVGSQLAGLLRALESASGKALSALQPHSHTLLELLKGNIQRSKIVCEGIQEAREDILRVFTHRKSVSDILTRQADKRCFRKHRSQS